MRSLMVLLVVLGTVVGSQAFTNFTLPPLDYPYYGLEGFIDTETMMLHHDKHHKAAIDNLNAALLSAPPSIQALTLTQLLVSAGPAWPTPEKLTLAIKNNAGSHFNHAFFWKVMRPVWYDQIPTFPKNLPSKALKAAIIKSFTSYDNFTATFSEAAIKVFGSGWTWLCYTPNGTVPLAIVSTPNQDNPLMKNFVKPTDQCIPILGIDMFEHAYYLKHRNVRADYLADWLNVVDWTRVSKNLKYASKGKIENLWQ